ncbi:unnamed protein product [Callosobruchus maculatus]|uniref:Geminin n=1 Tax=Callosobruchus maculatus TaxID=64391 RepID=A0A653BQI1_CALMS|nr:unnamed protein product [Callosobruchus maculatus]
MKTEKKVIIKIASDEQSTADNMRSRRTFRDLQQTAIDKENVGRYTPMKEAKLNRLEKPELKKPKVLMQHKSIQVGDSPITSEDLTSDAPGADYWKKLAETTQSALNNSLQENEKLKEDIAVLQEENKVCKEMLEESRHLVEVLQFLSNLKADFILVYQIPSHHKYAVKEFQDRVSEIIDEKDDDRDENAD